VGVEIKVDHLTKSFGKQLIWGDVTLTDPAGEICVMLGPSGTGKSVFLKTLIGLLKPDKGSIIIEGTDIASCSERSSTRSASSSACCSRTARCSAR
jgi:phospholipid/cholesterol/gamma-HCH transport system ATP-binding protein